MSNLVYPYYVLTSVSIQSPHNYNYIAVAVAVAITKRRNKLSSPLALSKPTSKEEEDAVTSISSVEISMGGMPIVNTVTSTSTSSFREERKSQNRTAVSTSTLSPFSSSSRIPNVEVESSAPREAKNTHGLLWKIAQEFVAETTESTATHIFFDTRGRVEDAALAGQQWGQIDTLLLEDKEDEEMQAGEEMQAYKFNHSNEEVTDGYEAIEDGDNSIGNNDIVTMIGNQQEQKISLQEAKTTALSQLNAANGHNEDDDDDEDGNADDKNINGNAGSRSSFSNNTNQHNKEGAARVKEAEDDDNDNNDMNNYITTMLDGYQQQRERISLQQTKTTVLSQHNAMDDQDVNDGNYGDHSDNDKGGSRRSCSCSNNANPRDNEVAVRVEEVDDDDNNNNSNKNITTIRDAYQQHQHQQHQQQRRILLQETKTIVLSQTNAMDIHGDNGGYHNDGYHSDNAADNNGSRSSYSNSTNHDSINAGVSTRSKNYESGTEITTEYLETDLVTSVEEEQVEEQEYITNHDLLESQSQHGIRR